MPAIKTPHLRRPHRLGAAALLLTSLVHAAASADTEAVCRTVAERYAAGYPTTPEADPLAFFKKIHDPRVTIADPIKKIGSLEDFTRWAQSQRRPLELPKALLESLADSSGVMDLQQLPGTRFYAIHSVDGTAACYDSHYFVVRGDRATEMRPPRGMQSKNPDFSCGVERTFGEVDQMPVYMQQNQRADNEMNTSLRILPWQSGQLGDACEVRLEHAPKLSIPLVSDPTRSCNAANCDALTQAALSIVQHVRTNPDTALDHYLGLVTAEQRATFVAARKVSDEARAAREKGMLGASTEPESTNFIDVAPLRVPYVLQGTTYVVSAGRRTIGWRTFLDWRVTFESVENGKLIQHAVIPIDVEKGPLLRTTVSTVSTAPAAGR